MATCMCMRVCVWMDVRGLPPSSREMEKGISLDLYLNGTAPHCTALQHIATDGEGFLLSFYLDTYL